jgi:hypothetical protein
LGAEGAFGLLVGASGVVVVLMRRTIGRRGDAGRVPAAPKPAGVCSRCGSDGRIWDVRTMTVAAPDDDCDAAPSAASRMSARRN